jgi:hypothetical protein
VDRGKIQARNGGAWGFSNALTKRGFGDNNDDNFTKTAKETHDRRIQKNKECGAADRMMVWTSQVVAASNETVSAGIFVLNNIVSSRPFPSLELFPIQSYA